MAENKTVELIRTVKPGVVLIDTQLVKGGQKKISIKGSGFIIDKNGCVVSCAHVFNKIPEQEKSFLGVAVWHESISGITKWIRFPLRLLDKNDKEDLALFKFDGRQETKVLKLGSPEAVEEGEDVIFLGFPLAIEFLKMNLGVTLATKKTIISAVKRRLADKRIDFFQLDTHVSPGFSGAPVLRVADGKVIGVAAGHFGKKFVNEKGEISVPEMMGIARPIDGALELMKKHGLC